YIFQNPYGSLNPRLDVGTSLAAPLRHFERPSGSEVRRRVAEALERVEIPARMAELYPSELSGGQRQRVAIARALLADPSVLICDEVTSALDVSVQASVVELLRGLLQDGLSMIFVTHNLAVVRSIADSVAVLNRGEIVEQGRVDRVLDHPKDLYTQGLLADTLDLSAA
ncbi:peptide ABC transporter ATP-binding protein, partial [Leucobacter sp. OLES1]